MSFLGWLARVIMEGALLALLLDTLYVLSGPVLGWHGATALCHLAVC